MSGVGIGGVGIGGVGVGGVGLSAGGGGGGGSGTLIVLTVGNISSTTGFIAATIGAIDPTDFGGDTINYLAATNNSDTHLRFVGGQLPGVNEITWVVPGAPEASYALAWFSAAGYYDLGQSGAPVSQSTLLRNYLLTELGNDLNTTLEITG